MLGKRSMTRIVNELCSSFVEHSTAWNERLLLQLKRQQWEQEKRFNKNHR